MNKKIIIIISSIIALGFTTHKIIVNSKNNKIKNLENKVFEMQENAKKENKRIRDSAQFTIHKLTKKSKHRFDSIINIPPQYKYKKYEEKIYRNRNLDDALRVHSKHKRDNYKRSKKTNK